jgi:hypothetical protein
MKFAGPTELDRKSGGAKWRDLQFHCLLTTQSNKSNPQTRDVPLC